MHTHSFILDVKLIFHLKNWQKISKPIASNYNTHIYRGWIEVYSLGRIPRYINMFCECATCVPPSPCCLFTLSIVHDSIVTIRKSNPFRFIHWICYSILKYTYISSTERERERNAKHYYLHSFWVDFHLNERQFWWRRNASILLL